MRYRSFLCFIVLLCGCLELHGQGTDTIKHPRILDNTRPGFSERIQAFAEKESRESRQDFDADKVTMAQYKILEQIKGNMQKARLYLQKGIDTAGTKATFRSIQHDMVIAGDGVFTNTGTAQTFRNLSATSKILTELLDKVNTRKQHLEAYNNALRNFRYQLDSLSADPMLFKFPKDSAAALQYLRQLVLVAREVSPVDKSLKQAGSSVQVLLNDQGITALHLQNWIDEIGVYRQTMANSSFKREFHNIWEGVGYTRSFKDIIHYSIKKDALTMVFFIQNNKAKVLLLLALVLTSFTYLRSLKNLYRENRLLKADFQGQLVLRYPMLSAVFIVVNLGQFIFIAPPFLWSLLVWIISVICLSVLFRAYITRYWTQVWFIIVFLFVLAAADNLVLQASRTERWLMMLLAVSGTITGVVVYGAGNKKMLREQWVVYAIGLMAALELCSAVANALGRYNLAKALLISGFLNALIAIMFLWTIRLINEGLLLAFNVYRQPDRKLFYLNLQKVGSSAPAYLYVLLAAGWATLIGRNFSAFEYLVLPVSNFFARERMLGDFTFSINSILLFVVIIVSSVLISKIVSFFASDQHLYPGAPNSKTRVQGIGSWLLLIRIGILTAGLFLALAATGIPVGRITIILGALGVGIGFGLQTLVNNLVSGLIIAFEKPVNVGDRVDIDGQSGTIKSIGFRSSVIATWEGADVVMPNGDLLNAHLANWSLAGNKQRVSILIGIAYDADLNKTKTLLAAILEAEDRLAKNPAYVIQYEQFSNSGITLGIYFWTKHISESAAVKSDLIIAIQDSFSRQGIRIPFLQQDIHKQGLDNNKTTSSP